MARATINDYIYIGNAAVPKPPEFTVEKEDILAAEYTTMSGAKVGDVIGWKFSDMTLSWEALPQRYMEVLTGMSGATTLTFQDVDSEYTESIMRKSAVYAEHRATIRGEVWWKDVKVEVTFLNAHNS